MSEKQKPGPGKTPAQARKSHLVATRGSEDLRLFLHLLATFVHRIDNARRELYFGDLALASVAGTIALQSIESNMRNPAFRDKFSDLRNIIGVQGQHPVNALSIAEATGVPRETVRRKLKILLERGAIIEQSRGLYVIKPGFAQTPEHLAVIEQAMRDAILFLNECLRSGLLSLSNDPADDAT